MGYTNNKKLFTKLPYEKAAHKMLMKWTPERRKMHGGVYH